MKNDLIINGKRIKDNYIPNIPKNLQLSEYARKNRKAGNLAEIVFWLQVHKKSFHKLDFDRQKIIGNYIVDFYVKNSDLLWKLMAARTTKKWIMTQSVTNFSRDWE